jgi:Tfp pilus assembly protein PilF
MLKRSILRSIFSMLSMMAIPLVASARESDQCASAPTPQLHVLACTAVIEDASRSGKTLEIAYVNRALAYFATSDAAHAISDFSKALELAPDDSIAYEGRAIVYTTTKVMIAPSRMTAKPY